MTPEILEAVTIMLECSEDDIPNGLHAIFEEIDRNVDAVNPGSGARLRSTQVAATIVTLWKLGLFEGKSCETAS